MIWINFLRDLKSTASRLISVMIITAIAVMVYTGLTAILYNLDRIANGYFISQNVADYWITGIGLSAGDCRELEAIPGVTGVQPRNVCDAEARYDETATLLLYAVPEGFAINTPYLISGRFPGSNREILVSDVYASAQGLSVGDRYEITLTGTGVNLNLMICGLIKSPECLHHVSATTPSPDLARYGFAYVNEEVLSGLFGANRYNQICITADASAGDGIRQRIEASLGDKVVNVLALKDNIRAYSLMELRENLSFIVFVFPILFFLCAVLLMVSTMTRLVESARGNIGTFKALGYSDGTISCYYLLHAVVVVLAGFPPGALLGRPVAALIVNAVASFSDTTAYVIVHDFESWAEAFVLSAVCCIGSAWLVTRSLLKESPAQCLRPKPPGSIKPVLLERFPLLWNRLGFSERYIIRNTFRSKLRMATCVVGIAFCMALVFVAFALRDSLDHYSDALSQNQNRYDILADLGDAVTENQYMRIGDIGGVGAVEFEMATACWIYSARQLTTAALTVTEDHISLKRYDLYAFGELTPPADGMVLEGDLADQLGVRAGDQVTLRFVGDPRFYPVKVAQVNRSVAGAYVTRSFWRGLGRPYAPTAAYVTTADRARLVSELERYDFVDAWQTRETVTGAAVQQMSSVSMLVYILIVFGGGLASVVIYNLGIMSFFEQVRSLATLMVLGFYDEEIKRLQLSENIIFAAAGIVAGIPIGIAINRTIISAITTMPLAEATKPFSFLVSIAVTLLFAAVVNLMIGRKMRGIDMLGALKSIE